MNTIRNSAVLMFRTTNSDYGFMDINYSRKKEGKGKRRKGGREKGTINGKTKKIVQGC